MERGAQRRRSEHRSCTHARTPRQCQRFRRRVGGADASVEERPGAALARADAGSRSAAREHRRRVRRRVRESRCQALQRPRGARTVRPRRCPPNLLGGRARRSERQRSGGDASEARGARAQQSGALHVRRRQPNGHWAAGRCTARDRGRSEEGPLARAVWSARPLPRPARRSRRGRFRPTAPAGAVRCSAPGGCPRGRARHDLAECEEREHEADDAEDEHEGATPSAPGGGAVELPLFTGRAGGGPRPSPSRPVNPRRVASLRPRTAYGPRRTAVARRPSAWLGLTRISCVPRGSAARGRPLRPTGPQAARPPNKLRRPRRRRAVAKARSPRRAFASTKAWPRRPRARRRPSCQAALRAPTARTMKACHWSMPSR